MKREIIDRLIECEDGGNLSAIKLQSGKYAVRFIPPVLSGYEANGYQEQFHRDPTRRHDLCGIAYITWREARQKTREVKKLIRRKMAEYWVRAKSKKI